MSPMTKVFMLELLERGRLVRIACKARSSLTRTGYIIPRRGRHNRADDFLIFRIAAQLVPIFVVFEPGLVFVSQSDCAAQPSERRLTLALERIRRRQPVGDIVIGVRGP